MLPLLQCNQHPCPLCEREEAQAAHPPFQEIAKKAANPQIRGVIAGVPVGTSLAL